MNHEKFQLFSAAYQAGLQEAVEAHPEKYLMDGRSPEEYARIVSARILETMKNGGAGRVQYTSSDGFKRACKKYTVKSIYEYLEIKK